jgi:hypothetical protein
MHHAIQEIANVKISIVKTKDPLAMRQACIKTDLPAILPLKKRLRIVHVHEKIQPTGVLTFDFALFQMRINEWDCLDTITSSEAIG